MNIATASLAGTVLTPLAGLATLVVPSGELGGSRFALEPLVTSIGRDPTSDIFLDDVTVSRRHGEIRHEAGRYVVHDHGSLNGTYLNGGLVDTAELASGDELRIGKFKLYFLAAAST